MNIKKLTLLLLLLVSTNVFAEWTAVSGSSDGDQTVYANFGTIKRKGNKVKMWALHNFKTVQKSENNRFLSAVSRDEYSCEEETRRLLDFYWYSGDMAGGEVVYSNINIKLKARSIPPESMDEDLFKIACGKK
jgi:hypothetical protein